MRKSKQETAETRKRIVQAAAAEFRGKGMNGVGLSEVMAAAGLTHGGFYRHFDSKEQLVTEALGMNFITERMKDLIAKEPEKSGLETVVKTYVSPMHRDNRSRGLLPGRARQRDRPIERRHSRRRHRRLISASSMSSPASTRVYRAKPPGKKH